jgi:hypothetical protein
MARSLRRRPRAAVRECGEAAIAISGNTPHARSRQRRRRACTNDRLRMRLKTASFPTDQAVCRNVDDLPRSHRGRPVENARRHRDVLRQLTVGSASKSSRFARVRCAYLVGALSAGYHRFRQHLWMRSIAYEPLVGNVAICLVAVMDLVEFCDRQTYLFRNGVTPCA